MNAMPLRTLIIAAFITISLQATEPSTPKNLEIADWGIKKLSGRKVGGKIRVRNCGKEVIDLGAMRLRLCKPDGTTIEKTKWLRFKEIKPGRTRSRTIKPMKSNDFRVLWLDLRYYLQDSSDGKSKGINKKKMGGALRGEIDTSKLNSVTESFLGMGFEKPIRHNKTNMDKIIKRLNKELNKLMDKVDEENAPVTVAGQINIEEVIVDPDKGNRSTVTIKLNNDAEDFAQDSLVITLRFLGDNDKPVKTITYTVPEAMAKGPFTITIPGQKIPEFLGWDISYAGKRSD